jgi:hypothetical protein
MDPILIVLIVLAVGVMAAGFITGRSKKHGAAGPEGGQPGESRGHQAPRAGGAQDKSTTDRPAGPDAEAAAPAEPGDPAPGQAAGDRSGAGGEAARPSDAGGDAGRGGNA